MICIIINYLTPPISFYEDICTTLLSNIIILSISKLLSENLILKFNGFK